MLLKTAAFCLFLSAPITIFAQIEITEIMYDLEIGSDSGREWIEIFNSGNSDMDLSSWKLYENESNHRIKSIIEGGNTILLAGDYAILVDNYEKFNIDYPNFSGLVLDTAFSLKNIGETLILRNPALADIDTVSYLSDWGADGDGNSLQKIGGEWVATFPTLGKVNFAKDNPNGTPENDSKDLEDPPFSLNSAFIEINIKAKIEPLEFLPVAGADLTFKGKALGLENEVLENANYQWTFGDGTKGKGQSILHNYAYPGEYLVVLEVISGEYSRCDKLKIKVIPSDVIISDAVGELSNNYIEFQNLSKYQINLSWWRLRIDNNFFTFPKNTILLPNATLKLPFNVTKLLVNKNSVIQLLYPNGVVAFNYLAKEKKLKGAYSGNSNPPVKQKPLVYSVEKITKKSAPSKVKSENNLSNQTASVKEAINNIEEVPSIVSNKNKEKKENNFNFVTNKWGLFLVGIILVAFFGIAYATRLDIEN